MSVYGNTVPERDENLTGSLKKICESSMLKIKWSFLLNRLHT